MENPLRMNQLQTDGEREREIISAHVALISTLSEERSTYYYINA